MGPNERAQLGPGPGPNEWAQWARAQQGPNESPRMSPNGPGPGPNEWALWARAQQGPNESPTGTKWGSVGPKYGIYGIGVRD